MINKVWSEHLQGILNLDLSREIRFRDDRSALFLNLLGLKEGMTVLDVGCGPGALTRKLASWLGNDSNIIGIDRDINFVNYAREKAIKQKLTNLSYIEGDALALPLADNSVNACVSHTVIEHVPNKEFLLEQIRVCKPEGRISVMYARPDKYIKTSPELLPKQSDREIVLFTKLFKDTEDYDKLYNVGKYWPDPVGLPKLFAELGLTDICVDAIAIPMVIDNSNNTIEEKLKIINSEKDQLFENINTRITINKDVLLDEEISELKALINERVNQRLKYLEDSIKLWDYTIFITQIVSGSVVKVYKN